MGGLVIAALPLPRHPDGHSGRYAALPTEECVPRSHPAHAPRGPSAVTATVPSRPVDAGRAVSATAGGTVAPSPQRPTASRSWGAAGPGPIGRIGSSAPHFLGVPKIWFLPNAATSPTASRTASATSPSAPEAGAVGGGTPRGARCGLCDGPATRGETGPDASDPGRPSTPCSLAGWRNARPHRGPTPMRPRPLRAHRSAGLLRRYDPRPSLARSGGVRNRRSRPTGPPRWRAVGERVGALAWQRSDRAFGSHRPRGLPLAVVLAPRAARRHGPRRAGGRPRQRPRRVLCDRACDADRIRAWCRSRGIGAGLRRSRTGAQTGAPAQRRPGALPRAGRGRTTDRAPRGHRRIGTRHEKLAVHYRALVEAASTERSLRTKRDYPFSRAIRAPSGSTSPPCSRARSASASVVNGPTTTSYRVALPSPSARSTAPSPASRRGVR